MRREAWKEAALDDLDSLQGRERAIVNQTNIGTVSKATLLPYKNHAALQTHRLGGYSNRALKSDSHAFKLQALVYDILPSTTAVFSYAIGSRKLSVNEQFFVGAQTVVSLLQTTQIKQGVSFIAANKVYTSANKTTIV